MPKIIENPREKLMAEARRQTASFGYSAMTIRSVAKACRVSVGTVYNYFPSKEALVASYMLEDWKKCLCAIEDAAHSAKEPAPVLHCIYEQISAFITQYNAIFCDASAAAGAANSFCEYHAMLRAQLASPIGRFCRDDFTAQFIAESMLTWTMEQIPFAQLYEMIQKLF